MATPNRGYPYPTENNPATVPADLERALDRVDADIQALMDRDTARSEYGIVYVGDGTWTVQNGLGQTVPITTDDDGTWTIGV